MCESFLSYDENNLGGRRNLWHFFDQGFMGVFPPGLLLYLSLDKTVA